MARKSKVLDVCRSCGKFTEIYNISRGLCSRCYYAEYRSKNREVINKRAREWERAHKGQRKQYLKRYKQRKKAEALARKNGLLD